MYYHYVLVAVSLFSLVVLSCLVPTARYLRIATTSSFDGTSAVSEREQRRHDAEVWENFLVRLRSVSSDQSSELFTVNHHKDDTSWKRAFHEHDDGHRCVDTLSSLMPCILDCNDESERTISHEHQQQAKNEEQLYVAERRLRRFLIPAGAATMARERIRVNARDVFASGRRGEAHVRCYGTVQNTHRRREELGRMEVLHDFFAGVADEADVLVAVSSAGVEGEKLHYDLTDNLFLQVRGVKTVRIVSPNSVWNGAMSVNPSWMRNRGGREQRTSGMRTGLAGSITLVPGDILRVPKYHFHRVSCASPQGEVCVTLSGMQRNGVNAQRTMAIAAHRTNRKDAEDTRKEDGGDCVRQYLMFVISAFGFRGMDASCAAIVGVQPHRPRSASMVTLPQSFRQLFRAYEHCHDAGNSDADQCKRDAASLHIFAFALVDVIMTHFPDVGMLGNEEEDHEERESGWRTHKFIRQVFASRYGGSGARAACAMDCPYAAELHSLSQDSSSTTRSTGFGVVRAAEDVALKTLSLVTREYDVAPNIDTNAPLSSIITAASVAASVSFVLAEALEHLAMSYANSTYDTCRILRCISEMDFDLSIFRPSSPMS